MSQPRSARYPCRGCAGGTWEGSLRLVHPGVSMPSTEWASGTFVGKREQISLPTPAWHLGLCHHERQICLQSKALRRQVGQRKTQALGPGLHTWMPTWLAQAHLAPGAAGPAPGLASSTLCRNLGLTYGWTCMAISALRKITWRWFWSCLESFSCCIIRVRRERLILSGISPSFPCLVLPPEAPLRLTH